MKIIEIIKFKICFVVASKIKKDLSNTSTLKFSYKLMHGVKSELEEETKTKHGKS